MIEDRKVFLNWLKDEGAISTKGNLVSAEKAFFANSVVSWYVKEVKKGTMKKPQVENCVFALRKFLKGKLDLCWDNGIIKVRKNRLNKGAKYASSSMANPDGKQEGV